MAQVGPGFGGPGTGQVTWYLSGVRFSDGGTASGWFTYNYTTGNCSANITTAGGSASSGAHYTNCTSTIWSPGGPSFASFSTVSSDANQSGAPFLSFRTDAVLANTNAGGTLQLATSSWEGSCTSSVGFGCNAWATSRTLSVGAVTTTPPVSATPVPATLGLSLLGIATLFGYWVLRYRGWDRVRG